MSINDILRRSWGEPTQSLAMQPPKRKPVPNAGEYKRRVEQGYQRCAVVAACISLRASTLNEAPLTVLDSNGAYWDTHPFAVMMRKPNPKMGWAEFMGVTSVYLDIGGNAYWLAQRNSLGTVIAYWPYNAGQMVPRYDASGVIDMYIYGQGRDTIEIDPDDVIHLRHPSFVNAMNPQEGIAPIEVAWSDIETYNELTTSAYNLALSSGVPPGTFEAPIGSTVDTDMIKEGWLQRIFGAKRDRLKPMVLTNGLTWKQMGLDPRSQQVTEQIKTQETAICGIFRTDPTVVMTRAGMSTSTYNNKETAYREYTTLTRIPFWVALAEQIESGLYRTWPGVQLAFDISNIAALRNDPETVINPTIAQYEKNLITLNEAREALSLNPVEDEVGDLFSYERAPAPAVGLFGADEGKAETKPTDATPDERKPISDGYECAVLERDDDGRVTKVRWREEFATRSWKTTQNVMREAKSEMEDAALAMIEGAFAIAQKELRTHGKAVQLRKGVDWTTLLETYLRSTLDSRQRLFRSIMTFALESTGSSLEAVESSVDVIEKNVQRAVTEKVNESLGTLRKDISEVLEDNRGKTTSEIAEALQTRLDNMSQARAKAIAQTTVRAQTTRTQVDTWGSLNDGETDEGEQLVLVWITERDSKVRPEHERMDGEVVEIGTSFVFSDGTTTEGPALGGSASNAINCRCTVQAIRRKQIEGY